MRQARSTLSTALFALACSALAASTSSRVLYASFRTDDPDSGNLFPILIKIAVAGLFVQLFYLLSRIGQDRVMPWPRWVGEAALGGVTAYVVAGLLYTYGPPTTPIALSIAGVFGGFFGQRLLVWIATTAAKLRGLPPPPQPPSTPPGGDHDGA